MARYPVPILPKDLFPKKMPPQNSPEYVALAKQIAVKTGEAAKAPRTFFLFERTRAEQRYNRLLNKILKVIEQRLANITNPAQITSTMNGIVNAPWFTSMCREAAKQMATMLAVGQKASWREAAAASSHGREIYKALMREMKETPIGGTINNIVEQNAQLIKTVPQTMAKKFSHLAQQRKFEGVRHEEIMKEIQAKAPHLREFEARRIARTESAKAATSLVQARAEKWGLNFYVWRAINDERTRDAHSSMSGVLCQWSDPPNPEAMFGGHNSGGPYHPGCIYNCRCRAVPVLDIEDIAFPVRVHMNGSVVKIRNKHSFMQQFNLSTKEGGTKTNE